MPRQYKSKGFQELNPYKIAHELFGNLQAGDKVAITGRFAHMEISDSNSTTSQIVSALESRGLIARVVMNGGPMEDFCFLKETKKELVGMVMSTYVRTASMLGNAKMTRLYVVDSPLMRTAHQTGDIPEKFNITKNNHLTNPKFLSRMRFEVYSMEEKDYAKQ
jgi:hypothetical protein